MSTSGVVLSPVREDPVFFGSYFHGRPISCSNESILIYLTVSGSVIPMRVLESDSIASVKLRIQTCKGFVVNKQKLVFGGRELARNDCLVKDYGVTDGKILHLVLRLSDLQLITVQTACGKEFEFQVEKSRNVGYLKQQIARKEKGFVDLSEQELVCNGEKLDDQRLVDDICKDREAVIHLLVRKSAKVRAKPVEKDFEISIVALDLEREQKEDLNFTRRKESEIQPIVRKPPDPKISLEPLTVNPNIKLSHLLKDLVESTIAGLDRGNKPIPSSEGSGGAYFMRDISGENYASVFKPIDEEPMAVNNPRGLPVSLDGEGLKRGTRVGEGALREVAAYILDHSRGKGRKICGEVLGFSGVPPTVMVRCLHEGFNHPEGYDGNLMRNMKIGSLQRFMKNFGSCEDMGPGAFPVEDVHRISVLDIRLANADRHAGNILVCKEGGQVALVPIDHGYCLPENFEDCTFDWLYWPQAHQPFSPETLEYISSLDAEHDIELLRSYGWELPPQCARVLHISTMLLKKGAQRGLSPFAIGSIMCRETLNKESVIESIVQEAQEALLPCTSESTFLETISNVMDRYLDELNK
ncbi:hypothetical protein AMTRI_Chr01g133960 [Amborella trichopoda]|uniref:1-phosphatidylinositol 4-kinase n=1 Tax=Amborella trichopoda TaxID=13333 RepID=W1Q0S9_AMBTC|nr:phosphatidylinositol 4-kinase gamma 4 [Amborella trichopoda]ERN14111.1 hypothetical protein AMTR_s00021p00240570 [Amborella trichopoda]|eukprot:XP_006852644.1 phosphatidylinositol 4-kinase gamma 4 [Amborella trichopoda]